MLSINNQRDLLYCRWLVFLQRKRASPSLWGAPGRIEPWRGCWAVDQNSSPWDKPSHRSRRVGGGAPGSLSLLQSALASLCPARRVKKSSSGVDRSSTRVFAFPWCGGPVESKQGRKPAAGTAIPVSGNGKAQRYTDLFPFWRHRTAFFLHPQASLAQFPIAPSQDRKELETRKPCRGSTL